MYCLPIDDLENISSRLIDVWPNEKKILITGGTGFFGRWFIEAICYLEKKKNSKNKYVIITRQNKQELICKIKVLAEPFFEILQQDIQDSFKIDSAFHYVIHAASDVSKMKNTKESDFGSIVKATKNLLGAIDTTLLNKFLYISSGGVYNISENAHKEDDLKLTSSINVNSYAEAKKQSELLVEALPNSCIARCFSFVGPFVDPKMAVMDMINKKVRKQSIVVHSPMVVRSFMYPSDLVVILFKLLLLKNNSQVYNVGSDQAITLLELAKKISHIGSSLNSNCEVICKDITTNESLAGHYYFANIDRINTEYGNILSLDLDSALYKTFSFMNKKGQ